MSIKNRGRVVAHNYITGENAKYQPTKWDNWIHLLPTNTMCLIIFFMTESHLDYFYENIYVKNYKDQLNNISNIKWITKQNHGDAFNIPNYGLTAGDENNLNDGTYVD